MYRKIRNIDGSIDMMKISSDDDYNLHLSKNYKLVEFNNKKKFNFNNSILGSDVGIRSHGFNIVITASTLIVISLLLIMFFEFKI